MRYWGNGYDWRKAEAKLNALPQFITNIDGVDIHFIHVRSRHPNAMPLIIAHGWPGSVFEQIKLIGPLTDPTKYGGRAEDAFDVVIPSLPGFGFSSRPTEAGWGLERIGGAFDVLMKRLGYTRYVAQGGDWGSGIVQAMGRQGSAGLLGIHTNLPAAVPDEVGPALGGGPVPAGISEQERAAVEALRAFLASGNLAYVAMMNARPQAVGYGADGLPRRPRGVDARAPGIRALEVRQGSQTVADARRRAGQLHALLADQQRGLVGEDLLGEPRTKPRSVRPRRRPTRSRSRWPSRCFRTRSIDRRRHGPAARSRNLIYFHEAESGGHFAAWEYPELFAAELRAAFQITPTGKLRLFT